MAEISNIRPTPPVNRTLPTSVKPSDQKKEQRSRNQADKENDQDSDDDTQHIDEYA